ncbi:MAG: hypothetical protein IKX00_04630 [Bacilli bacterium]|nr:hypothetical protein [Bacilli bacterium]
MKIKVLITITICALVLGIKNVYAGRGGGLDINKTLCYYEGISWQIGNSKNSDENAIIYIKPNTTTGYKFISQFKQTFTGGAQVTVGSSGTIKDGFLYYTETGWKSPKTITQSETENLLSYLDSYGTCPPQIAILTSGLEKQKTLLKLQMYATQISMNNLVSRAHDIEKSITSNIFTCVGTDCFAVIGVLKHSAVKNNASSLISSECMEESILNEFYYTFDNIVNNYSKHSNYIKKFKNADYKTPTQLIIDRYSEGGTCYEANTDTEKRTFFKNLTSLASKALKIIDSTDTSSDSSNAKNQCQKILGDPSKAGDFAYYLDKTFKFIKFLAPLILIVVSIIDYVKVIASSDADLISKTNKKTIIRLIFALLLFMLPIIISYLLTLLGAQGKCEFPSIPGL